jgi:hypothetical protein
MAASLDRENAFRCPVLEPEACAAVAEGLLDLEPFWLPRQPRLPFYTLGATHYYDITGNRGRPYERLVDQYNPLLLGCFGALYGSLRSCLGERLGARVTFAEGAALPGFHIFAADPVFAPSEAHDVTEAQYYARRGLDGHPGNPIHTDGAHEALGFKGETLSFTLPIQLPAGGAGLRIWPLKECDRGGLDERGLQALLAATPHRDHTYAPGELLVHCGDWYHQARGMPVRQGDYRITLQGHGVRRGGVWHLFW